MTAKTPLHVLKSRARPALDDSQLVTIASDASPNASYTAAFEYCGDEERAKATRWLSIIRRDYGNGAFFSFVSDEKTY